MGIFDAFKGLLFGNRTDQQNRDFPQSSPRNEFKKPDWANEDEDDDEDLVFRHPTENFAFSVFSNPLAIHQYFEQQMNQMAKQFEEVFSQTDSNFNGNSSTMDSFFKIMPFFHQERSQHPPSAILPPPTPTEESPSLRDKCFKPSARIESKNQFADSDLDQEFKSGQIDLFKPSKSPQIYRQERPQVYSSQVFTKFIRRPDGSTEEVRTKQIGDKSYTKVIRTDAEGKQHIHEDIVNIDEDKVKDFQQNVGDLQMPKLDFKNWFRFRL